MTQILHARALHTAEAIVEYPVVTLHDGRIESIATGEPNGQTEVLTAAFLDIHLHGAMGFDLMDANAAEVNAVGRFLATRGVSCYLATTVTSGIDQTLRALERLGTAVHSRTPPNAAAPVGIHLEGPFLCPAKRGVHPAGLILPPDPALFDRFQEAANGAIRLVTVAPEMPGALDLIRHLAASGVRVSMGHSDATAAQALAGIKAGATSATHTFNAMRGIGHREPGLAGTVLDRGDLYAEAIVDGVHLDPAIVRLWLRAKGRDRAILVTDGMAATGMPDGTYKLGDLVVDVKDGVCLSSGALAGSVLTMDRAVANLQHFTGTDLGTAVRAASHNPAAMLGTPELTGLAVGSSANFCIFNEAGRHIATMLHGEHIEAIA